MVLIYDKYISFYEEKSKLYGKCALLLQVGGFFELYGKDGSDSNASEIASKLSLEFVLKDKIKQQKMAGIPIYKYSKYKNILLNLGYTVVKVEQVSNNYICSPDKEFNLGGSKGERRVITEIVSPGTNIDNNILQNYIVSLYIQRNGYKENEISISMAVIDISLCFTMHVYEVEMNCLDKNKSIDSIISLLPMYPATEYIIVTKHAQKVQDILHLLNINTLDPNKSFHYQDVQEIQEEEHHYSSLLKIPINALKYFLKQRLIDTRDIKVEYMNTNHMDLSSNCIQQLDVLLLFEIINKTKTAMGSRLLLSRLFKPFIDDLKIKESHDFIENMDTALAKQYNVLFENLCDFYKIIQKLSFGVLTFNAFHIFYDNLVKIKKVVTVGKLLEFIDKHIEFNPFKLKENVELNRLYQEKSILEKKQNKMLDCIREILEKSVKNRIKPLNICIKDNSISLSNARAISIKEVFPEWTYIKKTNETLISNPEFIQVCITFNENLEEITRKEKKAFQDFQLELYKNFKELLYSVTNQIELLDFYQSAKITAETLKLNRPKLSKDSLELVGLRHLIVENLHQEVPYITNDISFDEKKLGSVIYGCNSCGKSTLLKATGLAVIMNQAGLFVPCESMKSRPLQRIMTRILGGDDIVKGKSSFIVELTEISSILFRANQDTLVLVDEASKGSETESASAINYALIKNLIKSKSYFLNTTHLHNLSNDFSKIKEINVYNMRILINNQNLVFERKLQKGSGIPLYGLEVAKFLNFPSDFMDTAFEYRKNMTKKPSKNRYNSKHLKIKCEMCSYKPECVSDIPLDCHHINFQCNTIDGYNGNYTKNRMSNLITLCKECHIKVHTKGIKIEQKHTLNGIENFFS